MNIKLEDKLAYIIAVVNEFAAKYSLNPQQAYRYLDRFKGIDFIDRFYNVEHTQSFEDVVDDLALYCRNNGGLLAEQEQVKPQRVEDIIQTTGYKEAMDDFF